MPVGPYRSERSVRLQSQRYGRCWGSAAILSGPASARDRSGGTWRTTWPRPEAQQLYVDHSPPRVAKKEVAADIRTAPIAEREAGSGRPTKAERRATDRLRGDE